MLKYKRIDLKTKKDYAKAEKLQEKGWKVISIDGNSILLEREAYDAKI